MPGIDWKQLLQFVPMAVAGARGGMAGLGGFGEGYSRGAAVREEQEQVRRAQAAREAAEQYAQSRDLIGDQRYEQERQRRDAEQVFQILNNLPKLSEEAAQAAQAAGLDDPNLAEPFARMYVEDALESLTKAFPHLNLDRSLLQSRMGDVGASTRTALVRRYQPLYERATKGMTPEQFDRAMADTRPLYGGRLFSDLHAMMPPEVRWVPVPDTPAKGTSLEADLADARRRKDPVAIQEILGLMARQAASTRAPDKSEMPKPGRGVFATNATAISELNNSLQDIAELRSQIVGKPGDEMPTGVAAQIGAAMPDALSATFGWGVTAKQKNAVIARVKQVIGKALEGGVLRKEDEYKYAKILPTISDPQEVVISKINGLEQALLRKLQNDLDALEDAGFDVSKFRSRLSAAPAGDEIPKPVSSHGAPAARGGRAALKARLSGGQR